MGKLYAIIDASIYGCCRIKHMLGGAANELILWDLKAKAVKSGRMF